MAITLVHIWPNLESALLKRKSQKQYRYDLSSR
jgi:hypothetical protein